MSNWLRARRATLEQQLRNRNAAPAAQPSEAPSQVIDPAAVWFRRPLASHVV